MNLLKPGFVMMLFWQLLEFFANLFKERVGSDREPIIISLLLNLEC